MGLTMSIEQSNDITLDVIEMVRKLNAWREPPRQPTILPTSLYDAAAALGYDMREYVRGHPKLQS